MRELIINGRRIADAEPCYVIAELGSNHQGDVKTAMQMIDAADYAGVSAVKLQKRDNAHLYSPALLAQPYTGDNSFGATYGEHRAALELNRENYRNIKSWCRDLGMPLFATPFDEASVDFLERLHMPAYKVHSGGLTDLALMARVAETGQPVILSTGGGTMRDIHRAVDTIYRINPRIALLHCTASYPSAFEDLNLSVITSLRKFYPDLVIGWSCHVHNISMAMAAYALGARIIEVHITLNRSMKGTDHAFSLEPATLAKLVKDLNRLHVALGDGVKRWTESEKGPISKMRRVWTGSQWQITGAPIVSTSTALSVTPSDATTLEPSPTGSALP